MRTLIATTALALILGGPVAGQDQNQTAQQPAGGAQAQGEMAGGFYQVRPGDFLLANVMGAQVYAPQAGGGSEQVQGAQQTGAAEPLAEGEQTAAGTAPADPELTAQTGQTEQEPGQGQTETAQVGQTSEQPAMGARQRAGMENIGSVEDMIVGQGGELRAILVDVGGFLGIGSRTIALDLGQAELRPDESDPSQVYVVSQIALDQLQGAPEFDREQLQQGDRMASEAAGSAQQQGQMQAAQGGAGQPAGAGQSNVTVVTIDPETEPQQGAAETAQTGTEQPAAGGEQDLAFETTESEGAAQTQAATGGVQPSEQQAATGDAVWRGGRAPLAAPTMQREGYQAMEASQFTADSLMNANVYDANDENIGSVSDVVLSSEGQLEAVVLDVGGFLGLGSHTVAIGLDEMTILSNEGGNDLRAYVNATQEQLEQMPAYEGQAG